MIIRCPACGAVNSLDSLVTSEAASQALSEALKLTPAGAMIRPYLGLFRPAKRQLSWQRVAVLLGELLPAMREERLERDGRVHAVPLWAWANALEKTLQARDNGQLRTPLKSHGYLYEIAIAETARVLGGAVGWADAGSPTLNVPTAKPASATAKSMDVLGERKRRLSAD